MDEARAQAARDAVSKQVNKLRRYLLRIGPRASFKALFDAVQGDMPTLSGTLRSARRMGVVAYEGEHLLQGRDDACIITLLDVDTPAATEKAYAVVVQDKGSKGALEVKDPFVFDAATHGSATCFRCGKEVMVQERVGVSNCVLHRRCFECHLDTCSVQLTAARYASITVEGQLRFYCVDHFKQLFKRNANYTTGFVSTASVESDPHLHK